MSEAEVSTIQCRYSVRSGFELLGSNSDLRHFADELRAVAASNRSARVRCNNEIGPAPYDEAIKEIDIEPTGGQLRMSYDNSFMRVAGDTASLDLLAENIDMLIDGNAPHLHVEYYPGNYYVDSDSEPLIVTLAGVHEM
jgi:hypothetical protein